MPEELPQSYWPDVNRHCGELLAGVPPERVAFLGVSTAVQSRRWQAAEEGVTATLERGTIRVLGGLLSSQMYHCLRLTHFTPGISDNVEYTVSFDPGKEVITSARTGLKFNAPELEIRTISDAYKGAWGLLKYIRNYVNLGAQMRAVGGHVPNPEDYDLLLSELQRGVAGLT